MTTFEQLITDHKITIKSDFVPFCESRNADSKLTNGLPLGDAFNWIVSLYKNGEEFITIDHSCGLSYQSGVDLNNPNKRMTISEHNILKCVIDEGESRLEGLHCIATTPDIKAIIHSITSNYNVGETFEDWCDMFGYDNDSIKAKDIYEACIKQSTELLAGLGEDLIEELRESLQDY